MSSVSKAKCGGPLVFFGLRLTSAVRDCQHDGGDPGHLTAAGIEDHLNFLEEDSDRLGTRIGEANRNEGPDHHHPTPATLRGCVALRPSKGNWHFSSVMLACMGENKQAKYFH